MSEFCTDEAGVAMRSGYLAPDNADLASLAFGAGAVDVGDAFAEVEPEEKLV